MPPEPANTHSGLPNTHPGASETHSEPLEAHPDASEVFPDAPEIVPGAPEIVSERPEDVPEAPNVYPEPPEGVLDASGDLSEASGGVPEGAGGIPEVAGGICAAAGVSPFTRDRHRPAPLRPHVQAVGDRPGADDVDRVVEVAEEDHGDRDPVAGEGRRPQSAAPPAIEPEEEGGRDVAREEEVLGEVDVGGVAEQAGERVDQGRPGGEEGSAVQAHVHVRPVHRTQAGETHGHSTQET